MNALFAGLGRFSVRFRWIVLLAWIVLIVLSTRLLPSLGSEINNQNSQFLPSNAPAIKATNLATPLLGDQIRHAQVLVMAASTSGAFTTRDFVSLGAEVTQLRSLPHVDEAKLAGISADGRAAELYLDASINESNIAGATNLINEVTATFRAIGAPKDLELHLAGPVAEDVANQQSSQTTGSKVQGFSFLLIVVLLLLIFRSFLAPVITLLPAGFSLVIANRFIGGLGAHGLQISEITQLLLIVLMLGAGTDYGLFLVFRVREELRAGAEPGDAVARALYRVGESIAASAATVIFALLSLVLASFGIYRDLGIPLAVGVGVMLVAGLTLLPALLAIFGRAAFYPSSARATEDRVGWWGRVAQRLLAHPGRALLLGLVLFGALASAAISFRAGGFGGAVTAPAGSDAARGDAILARYFPEASANPTNLLLAYATPIWSHPEVIAEAEAVLEHSGLFTKLVGPLDPTGTPLSPEREAQLERSLGPARSLPIAEPPTDHLPVATYNAYRATALFLSPDGKLVQFEASLRAGDAQSNPAIRAVPAIRAALGDAARATGASNNGVAGEAPALYDVAATSNADLIHIIPIAILAIGILLGLVLRSLVAPLYLIASVALSYFAALGLCVFFFMDLGGETGLTFILPFLMFIFLLALGEDYNILVMTRIREEAHHRDLHDAVVYAVGRTGPTITSAGLVLAGTFLVFSIAGSSGPGGTQIEAIGLGLGLGVLLDTFVVRTLLVPATVLLLGRWNWWPSKLAAPVLDAEAEARPVPATVS